MKVITVRMPDELLDIVDELAERMDTDRSTVIRQMVFLGRFLFDERMTLDKLFDMDVVEFALSRLTFSDIIREVSEVSRDTGVMSKELDKVVFSSNDNFGCNTEDD